MASRLDVCKEMLKIYQRSLNEALLLNSSREYTYIQYCNFISCVKEEPFHTNLLTILEYYKKYLDEINEIIITNIKNEIFPH